MPTRAELQAQLDRVEAQIADTRQEMEGADFETRQALAGRLSLLEGRAQSIRQQIAMTPDAVRMAPLEVARPKKTAASKKKASARKKTPARRSGP